LKRPINGTFSFFCR